MSVFFLCLCPDWLLRRSDHDTSSGKKAGNEVLLFTKRCKRSEAPDFTCKLNTAETFTLSDKKGQVILLNFWATWCSNCVKEMPAIEKLYEEYGDQIVIVGVNVGEDEDTIDTFIEAKNYSFPVACDTESNISNLYPSAGIPYTVIVGKDGLVTETYLGAKDADSQYTKLRRALQKAYEAN